MAKSYVKILPTEEALNNTALQQRIYILNEAEEGRHHTDELS